MGKVTRLLAAIPVRMFDRSWLPLYLNTKGVKAIDRLPVPIQQTFFVYCSDIARSYQSTKYKLITACALWCGSYMYLTRLCMESSVNGCGSVAPRRRARTSL